VGQVDLIQPPSGRSSQTGRSANIMASDIKAMDNSLLSSRL